LCFIGLAKLHCAQNEWELGTPTPLPPKLICWFEDPMLCNGMLLGLPRLWTIICHIVPTPPQTGKTTSIVGTLCDPTYLNPWLCPTLCPSPYFHFSPETWSDVNPAHPIPIAKHYHTLRWTTPLAHKQVYSYDQILKNVLISQTFENFRTQMLTTEGLVIGDIYIYI